MRPFIVTLAALGALAASVPDASAQQRGGRQPGGSQQQDDTDRRERQRREWETPRARLDENRNAGPCPFVKVLYDAGRYVEFAGAQEAPGAVAWTGEIQGVEANCRYQGDDPIRVDVDVDFTLGRGPRAEGQSKQYRWWVAVTERNRSVIAKEYFAVNAQFRPGQDRLAASESLGGITIPRRDAKILGSNFEVLIGFDVTPQMAEFNRDGKRFRANAVGAPAPGGANTGQTGTR